MNITNLLGTVKGFLNWERIIYYIGIAGLIATIIFMSQCDKKVTFADCEEIAVSYCDNIVLGVYDSLTLQHSRQLDSKPIGDTIFMPAEVIYKRTATFVKNLKELEELRAKHAELEEAHAETVAALEEVNKETFSDLGQWFEVPTEEVEAPIIETIKRDSSDQYNFYAKIQSRGQLEHYEHDLKVYPKTITITKTQVETLKRKNFLAIKGGIIYYDSRNQAYPFTLQYGRSIFSIEAGPVVNKNFQSIDGWQVQGGIVIKFK